MKPKIADLERLETKRSDRGWMATLDEHRFLWTCLPDLLRLARAAKEAQELLVSEDAADAAIHHAYDSALDAFDWGEK